MNKRFVILGGGRLCDALGALIKTEDTVICADSGYDHACRLGLSVSFVLGDMDSVQAKPAGNTRVYPARKDDTDGELAIRYAVEHGADEILLLGFTGTRLDHTFTNLTLMKLAAEAGVFCYVADEYQVIYYLYRELILTGIRGQTLSILPAGGDLEGVVTEGLEYPLKNETLYFGQSRGVSNVVTDEVCRIHAEKGSGLVVVVNRGAE